MSCAVRLSKMIREIKQKQCPKCNKWRELREFHNNKKQKDKLSYYCKECRAEQEKMRYEEKRKPIRYLNRKKQRAWVCKHCGILKPKELYHKNGKYPDGTQLYQSWCAECTKEVNRRKRLLNEKDYNALFAQQEGKCAICGIHQDEIKTSLHIDHKHGTKEIRGLLCFKCNAALGMMKDDTEILQKAIQYLNRAKIKVYIA